MSSSLPARPPEHWDLRRLNYFCTMRTRNGLCHSANKCSCVPGGASGACTISSDGRLIVSPAYSPGRVIDTLGAGDTFVAGFIFASLFRGAEHAPLDVQQRLEFGCRVAGEKCGVLGFVEQTAEAALAWLLQRRNGQDSVSSDHKCSQKTDLEYTLARQNGVVYIQPAVVYRGTYCGRNLLGLNVTPNAADQDERGYVPVERWLVSPFEAENETKWSRNEPEGVSRAVLQRSGQNGDYTVSLAAIADLLLGPGWRTTWPLVKLLDIGGRPVQPHFPPSGLPAPSAQEDQPARETPPIPVHVHAGYVRAPGIVCGPGKYEAYYFLPVDVPPYRLDLRGERVITRLGVQPQVSQEEFLSRMREFGKSDALYDTLNGFCGETWRRIHGVARYPTCTRTMANVGNADPSG